MMDDFWDALEVGSIGDEVKRHVILLEHSDLHNSIVLSSCLRTICWCDYDFGLY